MYLHNKSNTGIILCVFFSSVTLIRSTYWWYGIIVTCVFKIYVCRNSSKILMWNVLRVFNFFSALFLLTTFCAVSHLPTFVLIFQMSLVVKFVDILLFCFWGVWGPLPPYAWYFMAVCEWALPYNKDKNYAKITWKDGHWRCNTRLRTTIGKYKSANAKKIYNKWIEQRNKSYTNVRLSWRFQSDMPMEKNLRIRSGQNLEYKIENRTLNNIFRIDIN